MGGSERGADVVVWFSVGVAGLVWRHAVSHKIVLDEGVEFELSDSDWNALVEKGYIVDDK